MELVTGSTGIVGTHLLLARTAAGATVRALVRPGADRRIVDRVFQHYRSDAADLLKRIDWSEGDLHDMPSLENAMAGVTHVYHAAALVSFDPRDDKALYHLNAQGTANVVNAALSSGVQRLCHVSSTAAIGKTPGIIERDETLPWAEDRNTSPYAASKYAAEMEVYRGIAEGLDAVIVNPCIILGPGQAGRSTMSLVERIQRGTSFYSTGSNAVVDARDVAACMVRLMNEGRTGERYLLVGENVSYRKLFAAIADAFGKPAPGRALPGWVLGLAWRAERLRTIFGGRPFITRHTAHSAMLQRSFSNAKVRSALHFEFRQMKDSVANVARFAARN
jgi:dihydroflavonol-4-reductase